MCVQPCTIGTRNARLNGARLDVHGYNGVPGILILICVHAWNGVARNACHTVPRMNANECPMTLTLSCAVCPIFRDIPSYFSPFCVSMLLFHRDKLRICCMTITICVHYIQCARGDFVFFIRLHLSTWMVHSVHTTFLCIASNPQMNSMWTNEKGRSAWKTMCFQRAVACVL